MTPEQDAATIAELEKQVAYHRDRCATRTLLELHKIVRDQEATIAQQKEEITRLNNLLDYGYMAVANGVNADLQSELSACRKELEESKELIKYHTERVSARQLLELTAERDRLAAQIKEAGEPVAEVLEFLGDSIFKIRIDRPTNIGEWLYPYSPPIREGWVMVPLEPTEEMIDAAHTHWNDFTLRTWADIYKTMLSAVKKD